MKDKITDAILIILGCMLALMILWLLMITSKPRYVDCDNLVKTGNGYKPMPIQCEKGGHDGGK